MKKEYQKRCNPEIFTIAYCIEYKTPDCLNTCSFADKKNSPLERLFKEDKDF